MSAGVTIALLIAVAQAAPPPSGTRPLAELRPTMTHSEATAAWSRCLFAHADRSFRQPDSSEIIARGALAGCLTEQGNLEFVFFYPFISTRGYETARRLGREMISEQRASWTENLISYVQNMRSGYFAHISH